MFDYILNVLIGLDTQILDGVSGFFIGYVPFFKIITTVCGLAGGLVCMVLGCALFWFFVSKKRAWLYVSALVTSFTFSYSLKYIFERARPLEAFVSESSFAFPSGHSTMSAVIATALIGWVIQDTRITARVRYSVIALAVLFAFFIGLSRVVLRAHYPTDVLIGWCIGVLGTLCVERVISYLNKKKQGVV